MFTAIKTSLSWLSYFSVASLLLLMPTVTNAQSDCGDIISFAPPFFDEAETTPIDDCVNPFNADDPAPFVATLTINSEDVSDGTTIVVEEGLEVMGSYVISNPNRNFAFQPLTLFKKAGSDWLQVEAVGGNSFTFDSLAAGTYTAVFQYEEPPMVSQNQNWFEKIKLFLVPTVSAFYPDFVDVVTIEFEIVIETVESEGASSVLFLPGIKASRLYTDGFLGEDKLWLTLADDDVELLRMTDTGESINEIYTRDIIGNAFLTTPIYSGFVSQMESLVDVGIISNFIPFAYDWRFDVFDIATEDVQYENEVKRLLDEVLALAEDSYTGKVTIIGHSNGGLVAKALLHEYGDTDLAGKVDKLIMVGTPQLGTPAAIGSGLHGLDESLLLGLSPSQTKMRAIARNTPVLYSLLPSQKYFDVTGDEVVTTDGSVSAEHIAAYGEINDVQSLRALLTNSLDNRSEARNLTELAILNSQLSNESLVSQDILDNWLAPDGVEIYEIAGTGLPTLKTINYKEFGCIAASVAICSNFKQLKPDVTQTNQGDGTVVLASATGYDGEKMSYVFDLLAIADESSANEHKDLTENKLFQDLISNIIQYPYLVSEINGPGLPTLNQDFTVISGHSPISFLLTDINGSRLGIQDAEVLTEIRFSDYYEFGDSKYLVFPSDTVGEVEILGAGEGVYSLAIKKLSADGSEENLSFLDSASTTATTRSTFTVENAEFSTIETDFDGDGQIDIEQTLNGDLVDNEIKYTYDDLLLAVSNLDLSERRKYWLKKKLSLAERFDQRAKKRSVYQRVERRLLNSLERTLKRYERRDRITVVELQELQAIINYLKND